MSIAIRRATLLAFTAILVASIWSPAAADHGGGCGGKWTTSRSCSFYIRGLPISVFGDSIVSSGEARVEVRAVLTQVEDVTESPAVLASCAAQAPGYATCTNPRTATVDSTKQLFLVTCSVRGRGSGEYYCYSGIGV